MVEERFSGLLQTDIEAVAAVDRFMIEHVEGDRRLHGTGGAGDERDVPLGDATLHILIETVYVRADTLYLVLVRDQPWRHMTLTSYYRVPFALGIFKGYDGNSERAPSTS